MVTVKTNKTNFAMMLKTILPSILLTIKSNLKNTINEEKSFYNV